MSNSIIRSCWASLVLEIKNIIQETKDEYPEELHFIDWETHANIHELPSTDFIGPTALSVTENTPGEYIMTFAIGVSTTTNDKNLFRLRYYLDQVFNKLRFGNTLNFIDDDTKTAIGAIHITDGTTLTPMTRAGLRPWQYVQATALLEPFLRD